MKNKNLPEGISIRKGAKLLKVCRSTLYYKTKGEGKNNQKLMELIEDTYSKDPTMGFRKMVRRLMRKWV